MANKHIKTFIDKYFSSFGFFYRKLRYRIFIRLALSFSVGLLDGLGLTMFLPLLKIADGGSDASTEDLGKLSVVVDTLRSAGITLDLLTVLLIMVIFFILKGIASYFNGIYNVKVRQYFVSSMRISLSQKLGNITYKSFLQNDAGRVQNTMSGEVSRISNAYEHYFASIQQFILVMVYSGFAFAADSQFALLICAGGFLSNLLFKVIYKRTQKVSIEITKGANIYQKLIIQFVQNYKYLKATGALQKYNRKLVEGIRFIEGNSYRAGKLSAIGNAMREPVMIIIVCAVILVQISVFEGSLGPIIISLLFFYRALTALMFVQTAYNSFLTVSGSLSNVTDFEKDLEANQEKHGKNVIKKLSSSIKVEKGTFRYGNTTILKDINIEIKKNQTVAFIGESGSGKTTLVNLLTGLLHFDEGKMIIDGVEDSKINFNKFQQRIGYITQEPVIFNDTVFNNVSFWDERSEENIERFKIALQQAHILQFVEQLDQKEDTMLGNKGIDLSGGQKQRISIARELYKDVDILVLDEATSALDSETEKSIQKSIDELKGQYTVIMVAHRLSTIKNADRIILMNQGIIEKEGNYKDLIKKSDKFKRMVELQEL